MPLFPMFTMVGKVELSQVGTSRSEPRLKYVLSLFQYLLRDGYFNGIHINTLVSRYLWEYYTYLHVGLLQSKIRRIRLCTEKRL